MGPFRRFLLLTGAIVIAQLLIVASFNLAVDPFDIWTVPRITGFNDQKPVEADNDMAPKALGIARLQPRTVLLGSSRVDLGLDPADPVLGALGPVYNAAVVGGNMHVIRRYFEHWIATTPEPKRAIIGLDFFGFNAHLPQPPTFEEGRLGRRFVSLTDANRALLSRAALAASIDALRESMTGKLHARLRPDGLLTDSEMAGLAQARGMQDRIATSVAFYLNSADHFENFAISEEALADLRGVVEESRRRNIDLQLFIPPEHVLLMEAAFERGLACSFLDWKRRIAEIAPYWDFSGYNSVTTEPVARVMTHYWDASHFRIKVGSWILSRMLGVAAPDMPAQFGFRVTPETEGGWREITVTGRREWEQAHPDALRWLASIAKPPLPSPGTRTCPSQPIRSADAHRH